MLSHNTVRARVRQTGNKSATGTEILKKHDFDIMVDPKVIPGGPTFWLGLEPENPMALP